ncbi:RTA1 like protein-domain-containing protein [Xylariaceae sp. FL0016]|nr:RTA1 like protein-domain-containing protein [Xylariaceae sp. FL0016]
MSHSDYVPLYSCTYSVCSSIKTPYGYRPSLVGNAVFTVLFLSTLIGCLVYAIPGRKWLAFTIPVSIACTFEMIGYGMRFGSSFNPWNVGMFASSTTFLIIAPGFISVGIYFLIEKTVNILGAEHSLINPTNYRRLGCIDVAGSLIQAVGIAVSFSDLSAATGFGPYARIGAPIIAVGTGLQALSLTFFFILFGVVVFRASMAHRHYGYTTFHAYHGFVAMTRKFKIILVIISVSTVVLFARAIFQIIFLAAGFESDIAKNEGLYLGFNGFLVAEPIVGLIIAHPASFLQDGIKQKKRNLDASASEFFNSRSRTSPYLPGIDRSNVGSFWEIESLGSTPRRPPRSTITSFWEVSNRVYSPRSSIVGSYQEGQVFTPVAPGTPRTPRTPVNGPVFTQIPLNSPHTPRTPLNSHIVLEWNRAKNFL